MTFESALRAVASGSANAEALANLAEHALEEGEEERALPFLARALARSSCALLWQWKALLERALDEHAAALASFEAAAGLDPSNPSIAHGRARVALEAGVPAERLYEEARLLAPADGSVLIGLAAARLAAGRAEQAEIELDAALHASPLWIQGHQQLAQLRSMMGKPESVSASLDRALAVLPGQAALLQALFDLKVKSEDFASLDEVLAAARRTGADPVLVSKYEAVAAAELGETERADRLFASLASEADALAVWRIRHLLRTGRTDQAVPFIDREIEGPRSASIWPYASIAWRLTGDERYDWLQAGGGLVSAIDLADKLPPLDRLADTLRSIHMGRGEHLDQSLRGGTQTDGPLFSRIEPEIRAIRSAVVDAIGSYVAQLPAPDPSHPTLSRRRDRRVRFAGSWSVWLKREGFHVSHVHPQGWISSALYIELPPEADAGTRAGWLHLGQPRPELGLGLEPITHIKPEPGRLVLFPSWMWHGTIPFPAGERLSVAFDVANPG